MNNKSNFYSRQELFRLLTETEFPDAKKLEYEYLIKHALVSGDRKMISVIGDVLLLYSASVHSFQEGEGMPEFYMGSHSLAVGAPGTGKTFLVMAALTHMFMNGDNQTTVIWPDVEGDVSRVMPSLLPPGKLLVISQDQIKYNLLENAHVHEKWLGMWCKAFTEVTYIGDSGHITLTEIGRNLFDKGATLQDIYDEIKKIDAPKDYREVVGYRMAHFLPEIGPITDCVRGFRPDQLRGKFVVFDISGMSQLSQTVMQILLLNDAWFKAEFGLYGKTIFVFEEAHRVYRSAVDRPNTLFEATLLDALRSSRKDNLFCVITDHSIHACPDDFMYCSDTKALFRLSQKEDLLKAEKSMMISLELAGKLANLRNREVLFMVSGQSESANLYRIPEIHFKAYTMNEVRETMRPYIEKLDYVPTPKPPVEKPISDALKKWVYENRSKISAFLEALIKYPTKSIGAFSKPLPFKVNEDFLKRLADCRLIYYPEKLNFGRGGGGKGLSRVYTQILPAGAAFLGVSFDDVCLRGGKNKSLHSRIAVNCIMKKRMEDGVEVEMEWGGCDVVEKAGDSLFCYEYEKQSHPHIITNIKRDIHDLGASRVFLVMDTKVQFTEATKLIKPEFSAEDFKKISFRKTEEYI
nr:hypothetical protein 4 [bacterium]